MGTVTAPTCNHDDLMDWDCTVQCGSCGKYGPHRFGAEPYCDLCGKPHDEYFSALRDILGEVAK